MKEMIYREPPHTEILDEGVYNGFHYAIVSYGSHPCAYIEIPKEHPLYGKDWYDIDIDCHGGITYASNDGIIFPSDNPEHRDGYYIGWDYNHFNDYNTIIARHDDTPYKKWTTEEILEEVKNVIDQPWKMCRGAM